MTLEPRHIRWAGSLLSAAAMIAWFVQAPEGRRLHAVGLFLMLYLPWKAWCGVVDVAFAWRKSSRELRKLRGFYQ